MLRDFIRIENALRILVVEKLREKVEEDEYLTKLLARRNLQLGAGLTLENCLIQIEKNNELFWERLGWDETIYKNLLEIYLN